MAHPATLLYQPPPGLPAVHHADNCLLVVDKPSGLLSVPGRLPIHHDSAQLRLQAVFGPLWVVHRLDMDTSGLIVYARTQEAAASLGRQFESRTVGKTYEALVWGRPPSDRGLIQLPLRLDWPHRPRQRVDVQRGKPSTTRYERLPDPGLSATQAAWERVRLHPLTGRSHQLRVHLSAIGHAIVGDRFYGRPGPSPTAEISERLMLHAFELTLLHPITGEPLCCQSPVPF
ncbi:MAG: RluA family pseudouridine synthase [Burkholderiaceae bacterium]